MVGFLFYLQQTPFYLFPYFTDINECQISTGICGNGTCVNLEGHYRCVCHDGFRLHEQSGLCIGMTVAYAYGFFYFS